MSILDAKDLADRYRQAYEDKVDEETRTSRQLITELGGEEPYNILKAYSGFGLDPEEVSIRTRLDKKRKHSPLKKVNDAILIRTDRLSKKEVLRRMSKEVEKII